MSNSVTTFFRALLRLTPATPLAVVVANQAVERLHDDNDLIADAERQLTALKASRTAHAASSAAALRTALANAKDEAERNDLLRKAELDEQNDQTNATIKALEESIAEARRLNSEKLGELSTKHAGERASEAADEKTATDALALVLAAATPSQE